MWNKRSFLVFRTLWATFPLSLLSPLAILISADPMTRVSLSTIDLEAEDFNNERQLTFGMVSGDSTFFDPVKAGWEAECANRNINCHYLPVNYTLYFEEQAEDYLHPCIPLMLDLIDMGVDGISAACSFEDLTPWQMAHDAGIPLVAFDTKPPEGFPIPLEAYVGTDQNFLGRTLARLLKQLRPEGGTFGIVDTPAFIDRVEAFRDEITKDNQREDRAHWLELDLPVQSYDVENDINQFPWFVEILAEANPTAMIFMYQTPMRAENYTQFIDKHRHRNITYIGTDGSDYQLEYLSRRYVDGLVGQLPYDMGAFSVDILYKAATEEKRNMDVQKERQHSSHEVVLDIPDLPLVPTNLVAYNLIPIELPELVVEQNLLESKVIAGYLCFGIVTVSCVLCCGWTILNRNGVVVKASQPIFLVMTIFGIFLIACALIPLSFDDDGNPEDVSESFKVGVCMSIPWLVFTGFTSTFAALFSKTWRVNKFFHSKSQFGRIKISEFDVLLPFIVLLSLNIIILICWTVIDPLTYERQFLLGMDYWNREIESVGRCRSDRPAAYLVPLACVNFFSLIIAAWQAWQARDIQDEFSEGKYIGLSIFSLCQAFLTGVPIMAVVKDMPDAFYLVAVFLIFMLCVVVLSLVFLPKITIQYKYSRMSASQQRQMMAVSVRKSALNRKESSKQYGSDDLSSIQISGLDHPVNRCAYCGSGKNGSHRPEGGGPAGPTSSTSTNGDIRDSDYAKRISGVNPCGTITNSGQCSSDHTLPRTLQESIPEDNPSDMSHPNPSDMSHPSCESRLAGENQEEGIDQIIVNADESHPEEAIKPTE